MVRCGRGRSGSKSDKNEAKQACAYLEERKNAPRKETCTECAKHTRAQRKYGTEHRHGYIPVAAGSFPARGDRPPRTQAKSKKTMDTPPSSSSPARSVGTTAGPTATRPAQTGSSPSASRTPSRGPRKISLSPASRTAASTSAGHPPLVSDARHFKGVLLCGGVMCVCLSCALEVRLKGVIVSNFGSSGVLLWGAPSPSLYFCWPI